MTHFLISNDPNYRAATRLDNGIIIAYPNAGGKIDIRTPVVISDFSELSDRAGISERSHLPDPTLERVADAFSETLPL